MVEQQERAEGIARMLSLTSTSAAVALIRAQSERAIDAVPQISEELQRPLTLPEAFGIAGIKSTDVATRLARIEKRLDRMDQATRGARR